MKRTTYIMIAMYFGFLILMLVLLTLVMNGVFRDKNACDTIGDEEYVESFDDLVLQHNGVREVRVTVNLPEGIKLQSSGTLEIRGDEHENSVSVAYFEEEYISVNQEGDILDINVDVTDKEKYQSLFTDNTFVLEDFNIFIQTTSEVNSVYCETANFVVLNNLQSPLVKVICKSGLKVKSSNINSLYLKSQSGKVAIEDSQIKQTYSEIGG